MANGTDHIAHIMEEHGGEGVHAWRSHTHTEFFRLLHSYDESVVLLLGEVTPCGIMEYAMGCCHIWGGQGYLSKSAYGTIHVAVFHLFRIHNHVGFSEIFRKELGNLFRGFFQQLTQFPQQEGVGEHLQTLKVTLGSYLFLGFLFGESPLVGSKVINLFSNKGHNVGSNLETVAIELLSKFVCYNLRSMFLR